MRRILIFCTVTGISLFVGCHAASTGLDTPPPPNAVKAKINQIAPKEALPHTQAAYSQFIDVRTREEYAAGHAARAVNIPLNELAANLSRIEKNEPVYVICETGRRSKEAAEILSGNGYNWVFDVGGGTSAWREAGLPIEGPSETK